MKLLIKELLRESLLANNSLEEGLLGKGMLAGLLMTMGITWGQIKPEYKAKIDSIQKVQTLNPQEKRAEIVKIVQMNRDEIIAKKYADFLKNMAASGFTDEEEYKKYLIKNSKKSDAGLDNVQEPNFSSGKCGVSKAGAKQSKKDWKKK
tara:strand:+ start:911 stop:1357 length:447 start_codon:yes stop_codon:yes gene_type:complete